MSFKPTVTSPVPYPTLEIALFGSDGAEFCQWATKVIENGRSAVDSAKIILRAMLPAIYPFVGEREANRLADDYADHMLRGWPANGRTEDYQKVAVLALTAGLVIGGRIGKLTVANAAITDSKATYLLAAEAEGGVESLSPLARTVFGRPAGWSIGITPKRYDQATRGTSGQTPTPNTSGGNPLKGGRSGMLEELLAKALAKADAACAATDGGGVSNEMVDVAIRDLVGALNPNQEVAGAFQFRYGDIDQDRVEELFRAGGFKQDASGMWFDPKRGLSGNGRGDDSKTVTDGFTERPGGGDRARAGSGPLNFTTAAAGGASDEVVAKSEV